MALFQSGGRVVMQPRPVRMDEIVSQIARAVLGPDHEDRLRLDLAPVSATVDPARLEQIVANLVENAAKYSPAGTPIEITLAADGTAARLTISDHGPGIPPEDRGRIFDRYTRVGSQRDAVHGLGLGLFVVRIAVAAHGGSVVVGDRPDAEHGAAIGVRLPLVPEDSIPGPLPAGGSSGR